MTGSGGGARRWPVRPRRTFAFKLWRPMGRDARQSYEELSIVRRWRISELAQRLGVPELLDTL